MKYEEGGRGVNLTLTPLPPFPRKKLPTKIPALLGLMKPINLPNIVILKIHGGDYSCVISEISKCEAINLMQNIDVSKKSRTFLKYKNF